MLKRHKPVVQKSLTKGRDASTQIRIHKESDGMIIKLGLNCATLSVPLFFPQPLRSCLAKLKLTMCCSNIIVQLNPSVTLVAKHLVFVFVSLVMDKNISI